ncbi:MAG: hypothetical protein LBH24_07285 [Clostridiales bacterium]|jgi:2-keto-3-deoxy-6-phosphogluconate aldolase|nr:hypothetical protein [Clostridiales bacterium]
MKKYETLNKPADAKIIAIIRVADEGQAQKAMAALLEGGSLFAGLQEGNYRQITQNAREISLTVDSRRVSD